MDCRKHYSVYVCKNGQHCSNFYCSDRHPKSRPQPCRNAGHCTWSNCRFLHPQHHTPRPAMARAQHPVHSSTPTTTMHTSEITSARLTGFAPSVTDPAVARKQLEPVLTARAKHPVMVNMSSTAQATAIFETPQAARDAVCHFNGREWPGLGTLSAELWPPAKPEQVAPAGRPFKAEPSTQSLNHSASQTMAMVPGVAVLKALQWGIGLTSIKHTAVQALEQHHNKELAAEQELHDLLGHASHLSPPEMAKAAAANTCRQHQLKQQRDIFIGRVTKLLQRGQRERTPDIDSLRREIYRLQGALPVLAMRSDLENLLQSSQWVVIRGNTGSGKSTQLPQYLADRSPTGQVVCTQPRAVAAQQLAGRVAEEYAAGDESKGKHDQLVGYHIGNTKSLNSQTCRIKFVTEATLLAEIQNNSDLSRYSAIVLDEAHERSIHLDLLLGHLKSEAHKYRHKYRHLKICVTSATMDTDRFCSFLHGAPLLDIPGRVYPVAVRYMPTPDLAHGLVGAVLRILDETAVHYEANTAYQAAGIQHSKGGDMLVFMTTVNETKEAKRLLMQQLQSRAWQYMAPYVVPLALHSQQEPEEFKAAISKGKPWLRRVIFTTNIAETSLTIDGVTVVVDAGYVKEPWYDHNKQMTILQTRSITRSSAEQRAGRAGRTAPGFCYRLYSSEDFVSMRPSKTPEILTTSLEVTVLNLKKHGVDADKFEWLDRPSQKVLGSAIKHLLYLSALEADGNTFRLTTFGEMVVKLQMDPQVCRVAFHGAQHGMAETGASLAALLTTDMRLFSQKPNSQSLASVHDARTDLLSPQGDIVTALGIFKKWCDIGQQGGQQGGYEAQRWWCEAANMNGQLLSSAKTARKAILNSEKALGICINTAREQDHQPEDVSRMFAAGYFMNLASRHSKDDVFLAAGVNQIAYMPRDSAYSLLPPDTWPDWVVYRQLHRSQQTQLLQMSPISLAWIEDFSPAYYREHIPCFQEVAMIKHMVPDLSHSLITSLVGKHQCNIGSMEAKLRASVAVKWKQEALIIWALPQDIEHAKQQLNEMCRSHKAKLLQRHEEEPKAGRTRVVFGPGCAVQHLLLGEEFLRLSVTDLPSNFTDNNLQQLIADVCPEAQDHIVGITMDAHAQANGSSAIVHFSRPQHAAAVQQKLQGHRLQHAHQPPRIVTASAAGISNATQSNTVEAKLQLWWSTGESTGAGTVQFATHTAANAALTYIRDVPLDGQQLQLSADPELKLNKRRVQLQLDSNGRYTGRLAHDASSRGLPLRFPVAISKLPPDVDDIVLTRHFQTFGSVASAYIVRKDAAQTQGGGDALASWVPSPANVKVQADMPSQKHRGGRIIHYGSLQQTIDAAKEFAASAAADPQAYSHMSQPVRVRPEFTCKVSFAMALFDSRTADFEAVQAWCIGHGVKCSINNLPGQQPKKVFLLVCSDFDTLEHARRQLDGLLQCELFSHAHAADLFSQHARLQRLPHILKKARTDGHATCHMHWDTSTRQIRLYGSVEDRAHLQAQLATLANELADLESVEINIPLVRRRKVYQALPSLGAIDGVVAVHIQGDALIATCTEQAALKVQQQVDAVIGPAFQQATPRCPDNTPSCAFCMAPPANAATLQACGCKACTECAQLMFQSAVTNKYLRFPLACTCGTPICWPDVLRLADPEDLEKLKQKAYSQYVSGSRASVFSCLRADCPQVGRREVGTDQCDWLCDVCQQRYCVQCQDALSVAVPCHPDLTCSEYQDVRASAKFDDSENDTFSKCPGCQVPVFKEFGSCLHMWCTQCHMHFCHGCSKGYGRGAKHHSQEARQTYAHIGGQCDGPRAHRSYA